MAGEFFGDVEEVLLIVLVFSVNEADELDFYFCVGEGVAVVGCEGEGSSDLVFVGECGGVGLAVEVYGERGWVRGLGKKLINNYEHV